ncbi:glycoside hydrolase family 2 TIM barrel-domain containing protein [Lachnotalea sp. AF33-28]|uniref:glycoside hydrolase family 2 TIM barrel-domain containing protein n=1 Tax=Lachnotalea sp. AF33-28 TaxID=2292046 RepID=UPI000E522735|nr:glycoside hydrolase family 2 TIM barrel-domain containing protein [Lachnotalea sp. AF33-28]RHP34332.1 glycoside hydrolase family 2 protein [Lachnotalea sp. AF33-28]
MKKIRIHQGWEFWKDGQEQEKQIIELPHDAMILEARQPDMENGNCTGYYPGGKYYYAKKFFGKEEYKNQSLILEFAGVYMNSSVFLNGEKAGGWIYGYTNFFVDLTGKVRIGEENELLVEADNSLTPNSRWYSGSGIYRPVNLWTGGLSHITPQGLRVKTVSIDPAVIHVSTEYVSDGELSDDAVTVEYKIYDGEKEVASAEGTAAEVTVLDAKLWSAETPHLYRVKAVLKKQGETVDEAEERFGIRMLSWSAEKGFQVNGETVKLRGGCIHHDHGILGACAYDKAEYRRVKKLKEFGFNALRYSHYPAGKNFLDACDELGMYVMDESFDQWKIHNTTYDYSIYFDRESEKDMAALACKDYNHPSVILYSIGNEIADTGRSYAPKIAEKFCGILNSIDGTRPVTIANNAPMSMVAAVMEQYEGEKGAEMGSIQINELLTAHPELADSFKRGAFNAEKLEERVGKVFDRLDISGHNYAHEFYEGIHELRPDRILLSAETFPQRMAANWKSVEENDYLIGDFHWTAWDYLGETGVGLPVYGTKEAPFSKPYPCLTAACGSFDLNGYPEAAAYYASILWGTYKKPYIGVRPVNHSEEEYTIGGWRLTDAVDCWTWEGCEGRKAEILVYSIGSQAELYQDGVLLGRKELQDCRAEFEAVYRAGQLEAVSYDENGACIGRTVLETAGKDIRLSIRPEEKTVKADADEIVYVPVCVTDEKGTLRMMTDKKIQVTVEGPGRLLALGSARPETEELFSDPSYTSWHGAVLAVIRCSGEPGEITVTASADGCGSVSAKIEAI